MSFGNVKGNLKSTLDLMKALKWLNLNLLVFHKWIKLVHVVPKTKE